MKATIAAILAAALIATTAPAYAGLAPDRAGIPAPKDRAACEQHIGKAYKRVEAPARGKFCDCVADHIAALPADMLDGRRRIGAVVQANTACGLTDLTTSAPRTRKPRT